MSFLSQFSPYSFPLLGLVKLPDIKISDDQKKSVGLNARATNLSYLKMLAWRGFLERESKGKTGNTTHEQAKARLKMEFEVFSKTSTIDYILLINDIIQWCVSNKISRGPGRGSCAASYTFFCLGITQIDSIRFDLTFTRFISEARVKPQIIDGVTYVDGKLLMDVDIDISYAHRKKVIEYVEQKYPGQVAKIANCTTFTSKSLLKDVTKTYLEYDEIQSKVVSDMVEVHYGKCESLETALESHESLKAWYDDKPENARAFNIARALSDLCKNKSTHASGLFIYSAPLDGNVPLEMAKSKEHGDVIQTAYEMAMTALVGCKVDLLGVRTLDVIQQACDLLSISPDDIDFNDQAIYDHFAKSELTYGLFQVEEGLTKSALLKIKPRNIDQLGAVLAISRPGSLKYIGDFAKYTNEDISMPVHERFHPALGETGNILLYQEQVSRILTEVYGITPVDAENMRRIIGKKDRGAELAAFEPVLYEKGRATGLPDDATKYFWDVCNASADYLFNKAHSASYSLITAYTTYLKAKHPREFVYALLKMSKHEQNSQEALRSIISEAKQLGIDILPPDIVKSSEDFSIEGNAIRFGLSHIRGISEANMAKLLSFRRDFTSKFDIMNAAQECKIGISVLCGLIYSGCIATNGISRAKLALEAQTYNLLTPRETLLVRKLGAEYDYDLLSLIKALGEKSDENGKRYIKDSRLVTLRRDFAPYEQMYRENSRNEELTTLLFERHLLGFSYSSTLKSVYAKKVESLMSISDVLKEPANINVRFVGFVDEVKKAVSLKSKKPYVKYTLSDETGAIKVMLHGSENIESVRQFHGELPDEGSIVIISGSKAEGDLCFCGPSSRRGESFIRQTNPVKMSKGELTLDI